jgi:hypothetical protein
MEKGQELFQICIGFGTEHSLDERLEHELESILLAPHGQVDRGEEPSLLSRDVTYRRITTISVAALTLLLVSCERQQPSVLERDPLFDIEIGRLEDQVDVISRDGLMPRVDTTVAMRDGFVYISDGAANKIMEFTSFGDLVRLIYHPDQNPAPVTLGRSQDSNDTEETRVTRRAIPYRFGQLGAIAVDSRRRIYAEDRLTAERSIYDEELGVQLNRVVVRFDEEGRALDYLGQEGVGGTPFPFVERLIVTLRDELVVITSTMNAKIVYVFTPAGEQMYRVRIGLDRLPIPAEGDDAIAVLEEIAAGVDRYRLYLKISYYRTAVAEDTGKEFGISFDHSRLYWIDLESGSYDGFLELPRGTINDQSLHYELVGIARNEQIFLLARQDIGQTRLIIMNDDGRVLRRRILNVPEVELVLRRFALNAEGVLTALLAFEDRAELVWWRTDRLLPASGEQRDAER